MTSFRAQKDVSSDMRSDPPSSPKKSNPMQKIGSLVNNWFRSPTNNTSMILSQNDSKIEVELQGHHTIFHFPAKIQHGSRVNYQDSTPENRMILVPLIENMEPLLIRVFQHTLLKKFQFVGELYIDIMREIGLGDITHILASMDMIAVKPPANNSISPKTVSSSTICTYRIEYEPIGQYACIEFLSLNNMPKFFHFSSVQVQIQLIVPTYMTRIKQQQEEQPDSDCHQTVLKSMMSSERVDEHCITFDEEDSLCGQYSLPTHTSMTNQHASLSRQSSLFSMESSINPSSASIKTLATTSKYSLLSLSPFLSSPSLPSLVTQIPPPISKSLKHDNNIGLRLTPSPSNASFMMEISSELDQTNNSGGSNLTSSSSSSKSNPNSSSNTGDAQQSQSSTDHRKTKSFLSMLTTTTPTPAAPSKERSMMGFSMEQFLSYEDDVVIDQCTPSSSSPFGISSMDMLRLTMKEDEAESDEDMGMIGISIDDMEEAWQGREDTALTTDQQPLLLSQLQDISHPSQESEQTVILDFHTLSSSSTSSSSSSKATPKKQKQPKTPPTQSKHTFFSPLSSVSPIKVVTPTTSTKNHSPLVAIDDLCSPALTPRTTPTIPVSILKTPPQGMMATHSPRYKMKVTPSLYSTSEVCGMSTTDPIIHLASCSMDTMDNGFSAARTLSYDDYMMTQDDAAVAATQKQVLFYHQPGVPTTNVRKAAQSYANYVEQQFQLNRSSSTIASSGSFFLRCED